VQCKYAVVSWCYHTCINQTFELVNLVLATKEINEVHSGRNITACLEVVSEEYEIIRL